MFRWLRSMLAARRKEQIERLIRENRELRREIEERTGQPVKLAPEEASHLRALAAKMDPAKLKQLQTLDLEDNEG